MSNYNTQLQSNNTDLQTILNTINTLPEAGNSGEQATPKIIVNSTNGLITATAGTKSATYQMAFQPAKTITPSTASQIAVSSGYYTGGNITVAAVPTQTKNVTPTTSTQNITPDSGKFLSKVTINAIPSTYVQPSSTKAAATYTPTTTNQTIAAGTYLTGAQTIKGDSNLVAGNIKSGVSIFGVNGTAEVGGGTVVDDVSRAIIERTITEIEDDSIENIGPYAFTPCYSLTTANFPACTSIGSYAFGSCTSLTTAKFPACIRIFPKAFYGCTNLVSISLPACTSLGISAFGNCTGLMSISLPVCENIDAYTFGECAKLTSISLPACTSLSTAAFSGCWNLTSISLPVCTYIGQYAFSRCWHLTSISLPVCTYIGQYAFARCSSLSDIQFAASSVCALAGSNAFSSTPFTGYSAYFSGTPHIYVPSSLITAYQSATNWTYFSSYFSSIESLEV